MLRPYAFVCAPPRLSGYLSFVTAPPTPTERPALPGLRLPLGRRRLGTGAVVSVVAHGLIIVLLIVRGRELLQRLPGALGRGGGREAKAGTFSSPRRGRRFCRRWPGCPAPLRVAPTS